MFWDIPARANLIGAIAAADEKQQSGEKSYLQRRSLGTFEVTWSSRIKVLSAGVDTDAAKGKFQ